MLQIENITVRVIGAAIFLTALIFFFFPFQLGIKNIGNLFGIFICVLFLIYFIFNKHVSGFLAHAWGHTPGKIIIIVFLAFLILGFIIAAIMSSLMIKAALNKPDTAKPAILLGCKVNGSSPSLMLTQRLSAAYDYLIEYETAVIVVSGGQGGNEDISEAECMKNYLVEKKISESRIIIEDKSTDTFENIEFSKKLLNEYGFGDEAVIITDAFHQLRASMIAKDQGLKTWNVSASTPYYLLPTYWVREWFGIAEQIVFK